MIGVADRCQYNSRGNVILYHSGDPPNQLTFTHASLDNASCKDGICGSHAWNCEELCMMWNISTWNGRKASDNGIQNNIILMFENVHIDVLGVQELKFHVFKCNVCNITPL